MDVISAVLGFVAGAVFVTVTPRAYSWLAAKVAAAEAKAKPVVAELKTPEPPAPKA